MVGGVSESRAQSATRGRCRRWRGCVAVGSVVVFAGASHVSADAPPLPSSRFGSVEIGGAPAPPGTRVAAVFAGSEIGFATAFADGGSSRYRLDVPGDRGDTPETEGPLPGQPFEIRVGGVLAATSSWNEGTFAVQDLAAEAGPDVAIALDDGQSSVAPDELLTFTLTAANSGPGNAAGIMITAELPAGASFVFASHGGLPVAGRVTWPAISLLEGSTTQRTLAIRLPATFPAGVEEVTTSATITHDGGAGADPQPANNQAADTDSLTAAPDLITNLDDERATTQPGDTLFYRATVINGGTQDAQGVVVTVDLPPDVDYFSSSHGGQLGGLTVSFPAFSLAAGASVERAVTVRVPADLDPAVTALEIVAMANDDGANGADPSPANNSATDIDVANHFADLVVVEIRSEEATFDAQSLALAGVISVELANNGTVEAGAHVVAVFEDLDDDGRLSRAADRVLGELAHDGLQPGELGALSVPVSGVLELRGDRLFVALDADAAIVELDETNNFCDTGSACEAGADLENMSPVVELEWPATGGPAFEPLSVDSVSTPIVLQLTDDNGDGLWNERDIPDVIFVTANLAPTFPPEPDIVLRAIRGDSGAALWNVPGLFTVPPSFISLSGLAGGDIDLDGKPEIVTSVVSPNGYGFLQAYEHNGAFKWRSDNFDTHPFGSGTSNRDSPLLADLEGDGDVEIVVGAHVFDHSGNLLWAGGGGQAYQTQRNNQIVGGAISVAADVDLDGRQEIVTGNTLYRWNGEVVWERAEPDGYPAVLNADGDPQAEIVVVARGFVRLHDTDGSLLWGPIEMPGSDPESGGPPSVGDLDDDGLPEIVVAGSDILWALRLDGTALWQASTRDYSSSQTGAALFDFDGDGANEVVYRDERRLRIYRGVDGEVLFEHVLSSTTMTEMPVVADVDRDGNAEIVVTSDHAWDYPVPAGERTAGLRVFGEEYDSWRVARPIWNQHAYSIDNVEADGRIPAHSRWGWIEHETFRANSDPFLSRLASPDVTAGRLLVDVSALPLVTATARIGNAGATTVAPGIIVNIHDGATPDYGNLLATGVVPIALSPGSYFDLTFSFDAGAGLSGAISVFADATARESECDETNNTHSVAIDVASLGLWLTKSDGVAAASPGEVLTYSLIVHNAFAGVASGIELTDILPLGATFLAASDGGSEASGTVSWPPFVLASTGVALRTVTAVIDPDLPLSVTSITNSASVTDDGSQGVDPTPANNLASDSDAVTSVIADAGGPYIAGEGQQVTLDGSASHDRDGGPLLFAWDLDGDGAFDDATTAVVTTQFADEGAFTVRLRVTDDEGEIDSDDANVSIANVPPVVAPPPSVDGAEGAPVDLGGFAVSDPGVADLLSATVNWGDGTVESIPVSGGVPVGEHDYAEDGAFTVEVCVDDGDGASACGSAPASIANEAPVVRTVDELELSSWVREELGGGATSRWTVSADGLSATEDLNGEPTFFHGDVPGYGSIELSVRVSDNGDDDYFGFAVGFEAGDTSRATAEYLLLDWKREDQSGARRGLALSRVFGAPYSGEFWLHQDQAGNGAANRVVELARGATLAATGWARHTDYRLRLEATPTRLRFFVDGRLEIDYSGPVPNGLFALYDYSQERTTFGAGVADSFVTAREGELARARIAFSDAGILDTHTATMEWGDGALSTGAVSEEEGRGEIFGQHIYEDDGNFIVTTCATDDEGDEGCAHTPAAIENVPPTLALVVNTTGLVEDPVELTGSGFTDPGILDTHEVEIRWGDGATEAPVPTGGGGTWSFGGTHAYASPGTYSVEACVSDDDGGSTCDQRAISLVPRSLDLELVKSVAPVEARPGQNVVFTLLVRNTGSLPAGGVVLTDLLPQHLSFVSATMGGIHSLGVVTWSLGTMAPGATVSPALTLQVAATAPFGAAVTNSGQVSEDGASGPDANPVNNASSAAVRFSDGLTPIVTIAAPWSGSEGALLTLTGVAWNDTTAGQAHTGTISWGDGQTTAATLSPSSGTSGAVNGSHVYVEDGTYSVQICVTDASSRTGCRSGTASIANRAPVVADPGAVDLHLWRLEEWNMPGPVANWAVAPDGLSVFQSINSRPSIFYSAFPATGTRIEGVIRVDPAGDWDDDFIGFVLGFEPGDTSSSEAEFILVDWKQETQNFDMDCGTRTGVRGLAASLVHGIPGSGELWAHVNDNCNGSTNRVVQLARGITLGASRWLAGRDYLFTFEYSDTRFKLWVDGVLQFDLSGSFPQGRLGFYNFSQEAVRYRGFISGLTSRFEGDGFELEAGFADFGVLDEHTAEASWDDGATTPLDVTEAQGSGAASAIHAFPDDGDYRIEACVEDDELAEGCGVFPLIVLNRPPVVVAAADAIGYPGFTQRFELATFSDPGILDSHLAAVDWGDLGSDAADVDEDGGAGTVAAVHGYESPGDYSVTVCVSDDDGGSACGVLTVSVLDSAPPALRAEKTATVVDNDGDGVTSPGDDIVYRIGIFNDGDSQANDVTFIDAVPAHTTLIPGSIFPELAVLSTDPVTLAIEPLEPGVSTLVQFAVTISEPLPSGVGEIVNSGLVASAESPPVSTDDPSVPGPADPTRTPVFASPALIARKTAELIDVDGDGVATAGDELGWSVAVEVAGDTAANGLLVRDPIGEHLALVPGSIDAPGGRLLSSEPIAVLFDTVPVAGEVTVSFRTTIDPELPAEVESVANQATVLAAAVDSMPSDDPATPAPLDPTVVAVYVYPALSLSGVSAPEGDVGLTPIAFALTLDRTARLPVSVDWVVEGLSAVAGEDFVAASGTATIPVGSAAGEILVQAIGDFVVENDETFRVTLSAPAFAELLVSDAVATLQNDDSTALSVADGSVVEGDSAAITITLSAPSALPVTLEWMTVEGSAMPGVDYTEGGGSATMPPLATTLTVQVESIEDSEEEPNEALTVALLGSTVATIADGQAELVILDDDAPTCTISCPAGMSVDSDAGACGASLTTPDPTPVGECGIVSCSPVSGFFPVGTTNVVCSSSTTTVSCSFEVIVLDNEAPQVSAPLLSAPNAPGRCAAEVEFAAAAVDNCPGAGAVSCSPAPGSTFAVGTTTILCTAQDAHGNVGSAAGSITVLDVEPPHIGVCPESFEVVAPPGGVPLAVEFDDPLATDNCPGVAVSCVPMSGDLFPVGESPVVCTATDAVPLAASCDFVVTVVEQSILEIPTLSSPALAAFAALFLSAAFAALRGRRSQSAPRKNGTP